MNWRILKPIKKFIFNFKTIPFDYIRFLVQFFFFFWFSFIFRHFKDICITFKIHHGCGNFPDKP